MTEEELREEMQLGRNDAVVRERRERIATAMTAAIVSAAPPAAWFGPPSDRCFAAKGLLVADELIKLLDAETQPK